MRAAILLAAALLAGCAIQGSSGPNVAIPAGPAFDASTEANVRSAAGQILFWNQAQRDQNFPNMEHLFPGHVVKAGGRIRALPSGEPLAIADAEIDRFMAEMNVAGLLVLDHGKVRLERYARGYSREGRWTSFSVAKSLTSTLVGAAIKDGAIASLDDPVTRYIPDLAGSGYDGVTVRQILTMSSGVKWNEDYTDPQSDVAQMYAKPVPPGMDPTVAYLRTLPRESAPGTVWKYKTGETNLIGVLVEKATGKPLANYASEKIARPAGFEQDGFWMVDQTRQEIGGCCLSLALRDYGRMGLFALDGGKGQVPADWFHDALSQQQPTGTPGYGYGYQWWIYPDGRAGAQGIFGQSIYLDPARQIVIVTSSAWAKASDRGLWTRLQAFDEQVVDAIAKDSK